MQFVLSTIPPVKGNSISTHMVESIRKECFLYFLIRLLTLLHDVECDFVGSFVLVYSPCAGMPLSEKNFLLDKENCTPTWIAPLLSKAHEVLDSHKPSGFCERSDFFQVFRFSTNYRKSLGCTDAVLTISQQHKKPLYNG